jgi:hypothetical protein
LRGFAQAEQSDCGIVPTPRTNPSTYFNGVAALSEDEVWAVGSAWVGTESKGIAEHWDGVEWTPVPTPVLGSGSGLSAVAGSSSSDIWAVGGRFHPPLGGKTLFEHWDGARWTKVPSPGGDQYNSVGAVDVISPTDAWAVGSNVDGETLTEHWDGTEWTVVPSPNGEDGESNSLAGVTAISSDDVWAVGDYYGNDNFQHMLAFHWDGFTWNSVQEPFHDEFDWNITAVDASSTSDVWAVGYKKLQHTDGWEPLAVKWNGSGWAGSSPPIIEDYVDHNLYGVAAHAPDDVWAVGLFDSGAVAYHWDGISWTLGAGFPSQPVNGFSTLGDAAVTPGGTFWAVGSASSHGPSQPLSGILCG